MKMTLAKKNIFILIIEVFMLSVLFVLSYKIYSFFPGLDKELHSSLTNYFILTSVLCVVFVAINFTIYFYFKEKEGVYYSQIKKNEMRFKELVENSDSWIWEVDVEGRYIYSSRQVKDILGYEAEEILGMRSCDLIAGEDHIHVCESFLKTVDKQDKIIDLEHINVHKDGHLVHLLTNATPFYDETGEMLGYRGIDKDISQYKILESKLQEYSKNLE